MEQRPRKLPQIFRAGGVAFTPHEFLETWYISKAGGSVEYSRGKDTNTPACVFID